MDTRDTGDPMPGEVHVGADPHTAADAPRRALAALCSKIHCQVGMAGILVLQLAHAAGGRPGAA